MAADDLLADRESDAGAFVLLMRVQALEDLKDPLAVRRRDADAVVGHREMPAFVIASRRDVHAWMLAGLELQPVADQVLQ